MRLPRKQLNVNFIFQDSQLLLVRRERGKLEAIFSQKDQKNIAGERLADEEKWFFPLRDKRVQRVTLLMRWRRPALELSFAFPSVYGWRLGVGGCLGVKEERKAAN